MSAPVAIIGGGWAGCAAAVTLADAGVPVILFEAGRAREWYARAFAQLDPGDRRAQRPGLIMAAIYETLLDEIERDGYRVLDRRIALTPLRKLWIAWKTARAS